MAKLLSKDPSRIGRPTPHAGEPDHFPDRVPDRLAEGSPAQLAADLQALLGEAQVHSRVIDLVRYASDAGPYRLIPQVVVSPCNAEEMAKLFSYARTHQRHLTFRAGGSSLNGQAQGDDILVDVRRHFRGMVIEDEGLLRVKPGEVLDDVQAVLARTRRRFAPDPASSSIATIGGILANNSGGMRCHPHQDSYHSLKAATIVLASGTIINTEDPHAAEELKAKEPAIYQGLMDLRDEIRADDALVERLRRKFSIRNTNALRLDAFLDEDCPVQILKQLMVGSEGILGFIAEAVLETLPLPSKRAVAWVMLPRLDVAADYVHKLVEAGASAVELLVSPVLREAVGNFKGARESWRDLKDEDAALLLEVSGTDEADLAEQIRRAEEVLADSELTAPLEFTSDPIEIHQAWEIRGGLLPLLGKQRMQGATLITEDVCFPPASIGEASRDLMHLLAKYDAPEMVMGHAAFGNLHFFLTPSFESDAEINRYGDFIKELVELVLNKYDGSLKAEHGTGTNMAPFVHREWGDQAYGLMWRVKDLLDPEGILAPDVKLTRDDRLHLKNFKSFPRIEEEANACVECGFCENVCPSRHVTATPRQRIVIRREMARQPEQSPVLNYLYEEYGYEGIDTCAADASCAVACPISIDTGAMMKHFRALEATEAADKVALTLAKNWKSVEMAARGGLGAADAITKVLGENLGTRMLGGITGVLRSFISEDLMPSAKDGLPPAGSKRMPPTCREGAEAIYYPACINRMFGRDVAGPSLAETMVTVSQRAGHRVYIPEDIAGSCCATPFSSKGYLSAKAYMARDLAARLWEWSEHGRLPVVVDAASCTHNIIKEIPTQLDDEGRAQFEQIKIMDAVSWAHDVLLPDLEAKHPQGRVAVHPNCSLTHMELVDQLTAVAAFAATEAFIPVGAGCCGTAGDRGLLHPELLESATRDEKAGLAAAPPADAYVSANRTCEMGMTQSTGKEYEHILYLLEQATRI